MHWVSQSPKLPLQILNLIYFPNIFVYIFPQSHPSNISSLTHFFSSSLILSIVYTLCTMLKSLKLMSYKSSTVLYCFITTIIISVVLLWGGVSASKHEDVGTYELNNGHFSVKFTNWGATIISVFLPDKYGTHTYFSSFSICFFFLLLFLEFLLFLFLFFWREYQQSHSMLFNPGS